MLKTARVLLVDDGEAGFSLFQSHLELAGHQVRRVGGAEEAIPILGVGEADVVILSSELISWLDRLAEAQCGSAVVSFIVAAQDPPPDLVRRALSGGVAEVVDRAQGADALLLVVERAMRETQLKRELAVLRARVGDEARRSLIGRSPSMAHVRELVGRAAASRAPVLVLGEPGTGKDVVARLIHDLSDRAARPIVTVRCADADATALELDLFGRAAGEGHPRGRAGLLEDSRGGTLVLEDAFALPAALRARLVRASMARSARRVGASESHSVDVRVVLTARTAVDGVHDRAVDELLSQFNASVIELPPLRERRSDIPQLVQHFRQRMTTEQGRDLPPLAAEEMLPLLACEWPGNVRELAHWVERSALAVGGDRPRSDASALEGFDPGTSQVTLEQLERAYILRVLALESGHQSRTAERLGIDRRTLYRKLKQYRAEGALTH
jgi:two-component system response regulator HydG